MNRQSKTVKSLKNTNAMKERTQMNQTKESKPEAMIVNFKYLFRDKRQLNP